MNESREDLRARLKAKMRNKRSTSVPNVDDMLMSNPELFNMANDVKHKSIPKMIQTLASKMASEGCDAVPPASLAGEGNSEDEEEAPPPEEGRECVSDEEEAPPPEEDGDEAPPPPVRMGERKHKWGDDD